MTSTAPALAARYQIQDVLGEGGMGTVYRAVDTTNGDEVAFKVMRMGDGRGEADVLRFKQEFRAMTRLRHPNLCEVRDYGVTDAGAPFFTMEVVPGADLDQRRPLPPAEVTALLPQMLAALGYVHGRGFVHADVKPENFRVTPDGRLKLMDFGLMVPAGHRPEGIAGTVAYMAPEAAKGDRLDARSDLYALGAVLYELLTGQPPFAGDTPLAVLRAHLREQPARPRALSPGVPEALDAAVMKLLAKEPSARYASAAEAAAALGLDAAIDQSARLLAPSFVGHDAALAALGGALPPLAERGVGGVWGLSGPGGVGKSRVLEELQVQARLADRPVLRGCAGGGGPLAAWVSVLRALLPDARRVCPDVLASEGPTLARILPELATEVGAAADSGDDRSRMSAAIARLVVATLADARGVLMLDTWEEADVGSREALTYLLRNAAAFAGDPAGVPPRFLLIVAGQAAADLPGTPVALAGLTVAEIGQLAAGMVGQAAVPDALAAQLHGLTDGNPRAVAEVLTHAVSTGAIARAGGAWRLPDTLPAEALSGDVRARLASRLAPLGPDALAVARAAAVLADGFDLPLLIAASGLAEERVLDAVDELGRADVLELSGTTGRLAIEELRDVLLADLPADDGAAIHLAAAAALRARVDAAATPDVQQLGELARHLLAAGPATEAVRAALTARAAYARMSGMDQSRKLLTGAQARMPELGDGPEATRLAIELRIGQGQDAQWRADMAQAGEVYGAAIALAESHGHGDLLAQALAGAAVVASLQDKRERFGLAQRAIEASRAAGDLATLARCSVNLGRWHIMAGETDKGRAICDEALGLSRSADLPFYEARALASLGFARMNNPAEFEAAIGDLHAARAIQERIGDRYGGGFTLNLLSDALMRAGRLAEAREATLAGIAIMRELDSRDDLICILYNLAALNGDLGDVDGALAAAAECLQLARHHDHAIGLASGGGVQGLWRAARGDVAGAVESLEAAYRDGQRVGSYIFAIILPDLVHGWLALGRATKARDLLQEAIFNLRSSADLATKGVLAVLQAEVQAALGTWGDVEALADEAIASAQETGAVPTGARGWTMKAIAAWRAGRPEDAAKAASEALDAAGRCGHKPLLAMIAGVQGAIVGRANPAGATGNFQAMQVMADELGAPLLRAIALHGQVQSAPSAPQAGPMLDEAQRLLTGLAPEADAELRGSDLWKAVFARNPAVSMSGGGTEVGREFADQFHRVNDDLARLFAQYGQLRADWEASNVRLRRLNEVASQMAESLQLDEVLAKVIGLTLEITGAERGFVVLRDRTRFGDLVCRAAYDKDGAALSVEGHSLTISQKILAAGKALAILDASADAEFQTARSVVGMNLRTVMGTPLVVKGEPVGVLYVDSRAVVTTFTESDLELLRALALHAGNAIEHARLYESLDRRAAELEEALAKYRHAEAAASTDALTGLANRRRFLEEFEREWGVAKRFGHGLAVVLLDVDHFKSFNDTYGHALGDEVLKAVAGVLPGAVREHDLAARLGGEEFVVLCPVAQAADAAAVAERVREAVAGIKLPDVDGKAVRQVTASLGVTEVLPDDRGAGDALERADIALYACKHGGRNQVQVWREGMKSI